MELLLWIMYLCFEAFVQLQAGGHLGDGSQGSPRQEFPRGRMGQKGTDQCTVWRCTDVPLGTYQWFQVLCNEMPNLHLFCF